MNCPHHCEVQNKPRSYKDHGLQSLGQFTDEQSGELHGLNRRSLRVMRTSSVQEQMQGVY